MEDLTHQIASPYFKKEIDENAVHPDNHKKF
jgi:hypothetical protein